MSRRRPIGAELASHGVHFRTWAPEHDAVAVVIDGRDHPLAREDGGYFAGLVRGARAGTRYRLRLDGDAKAFPDPASRFQPDGPHGDSEVIDPETFDWTDSAWRGPRRRGAVIYEMHMGTFTPEGTWRSAIDELPRLAELGISIIEVMPVNEFAGRFGWGYDGVDLWAPWHHYGTPDDFRAFVDAAHALNLAVILDVVYNHLGPDGCYLTQFTKRYFTKKYENEWGEALQFEGAEAAGVREFFIENAAYWIDEFHLDGLRLDATQSIHDSSPEHVVTAIVRAARAAAGERETFFVAENEPQDVALLEEQGLDAMWNDDWHHAAHVALTGRAEAYYSDYRGRAQEFVSMTRHGFLYQGQRYAWQKHRRGTPSLGVAAERLVCYLQNHDQVANSMRGQRLHDMTSPGQLRAATALLLLQPQTPMLFQGQEFEASSPFLYFADHEPELAEKVAAGRHEFLQQFPSIAALDAESLLAKPDDPATFAASKLDPRERDAHAAAVALHRDLIAMRRDEPAFAQQDASRVEGVVLTDDAFVLRFLHDDGDRLLLVNFGSDLVLDSVPYPLLAPERGQRWELLWTSDAPRYGGNGTQQVETDDGWRVPGNAAVVLCGVPRAD